MQPERLEAHYWSKPRLAKDEGARRGSHLLGSPCVAGDGLDPVGQGRPHRRYHVAMAPPTTVEEYLATLPEDRRDAMRQLRDTIRAAAPEATETIAYGMPAFRSHGGQFLVSFAAFKAHYSLFPASGAVVEALGDEIAPYLAGRGTISFRAGEPLPLSTVSKVVTIRLAETAANDRR
jgi:uncharacterized protein YdhG (YjbR/CyaY superfamily)